MDGVNRYRALTPHAEAVYAPGVFELDLSPSDEADRLASGLIELVPRTYRVLSRNFADGAQGETIEAAYVVEIEAAHIAGGHLERVDEPVDAEPPKKPKPSRASAPKARSDA